QHYDAWIPAQESETLKKSLIGQLQRVIFAREVALQDLAQAKDLGERATQMQMTGDLILAYGPSAPEGAKELGAFDFEGKPLTIPLDPGKTYQENAGEYFAKAKKSKLGMSTVRDQIERLSQERDELLSLTDRIENAERLDEVEAFREEASKRRWLHSRAVVSKHKEERPYEGHRIRELLAPNGWTVLYGENAEANDYLVLRVAKPNDWWLHVRGNVSSHVVVVTRNQPEKVTRDVLEYAARIAVQHSALKHSGYVPVDYTLRKYVRKPRGAAKGTAIYTHEKTIHIES
ncbi:MAG TPA: NFACT RNA binding domain-containing protein, partial [Fimbriimonadaceae bacterium]|nr:NFACT RNA binding domain-containing protein [Fimbriimonadaceae bacterium]